MIGLAQLGRVYLHFGILCNFFLLPLVLPYYNCYFLEYVFDVVILLGGALHVFPLLVSGKILVDFLPAHALTIFLHIHLVADQNYA